MSSRPATGSAGGRGRQTCVLLRAAAMPPCPARAHPSASEVWPGSTSGEDLGHKRCSRTSHVGGATSPSSAAPSPCGHQVGTDAAVELGATWIHGLGSAEDVNPIYQYALDYGLLECQDHKSETTRATTTNPVPRPRAATVCFRACMPSAAAVTFAQCTMDRCCQTLHITTGN